MQSPTVSPRNFGKMTLAALGGMVAGAVTLSLSGCSNQPGANPTTGSTPKPSEPTAATATAATGEKHACAGLNGCQGQGVDGKNACAGQGGCASTAMKHECKGHNACKGQGGCGEAMGTNECKGHGNCAVPIKDKEAWKMARQKFEDKMKAAGKEVGPAPKS